MSLILLLFLVIRYGLYHRNLLIRRRCFGAMLAYLVPFRHSVRCQPLGHHGYSNHAEEGFPRITPEFPFLFPMRGKVVKFSDFWEECVPCSGRGNFSNFPTLGRNVSPMVGGEIF